MDRAYATFEVKSVDDEARIVEGIASTPEPDLYGDELLSEGAEFALPMPFRFEHQKNIGEVLAATVRPDGIHIRARVAKIPEPGPLQEFVDHAWQTIKYLARGLSVGWKPIAAAKNARGGRTVSRWHWVETSAVEIPANVHATIASVKSFSEAASRLNPRGVSRVPGQVPNMTNQTATEAIRAYTNTRATKAARMAELMAAANADGVTLDPTQTAEYDTLDAEVKNLDAHVARLRDLEQLQVSQATPVPANPNPPNLPNLVAPPRGMTVGGVPVIQVKNADPAQPFVRLVLSHIAGKGSRQDAINYAARFNDTTPEVQLALKAATAPATTTDPTWMGALVPPPVSVGFIELLRPKTILGRLDGLNRVPFNALVPMQTGGGVYSWVGENAPKPVTKFTLGSTTLTWSKIAAIIALSEELTRLSTPSAEDVVRREMVAGISQFMDQQFIDPTVAAVAGVSPASITNGITPIATTADPVKDVTAIFAAFATANIPIDQVALIMSSTTAFQLAVKLNALGQPMFPSLTATGGTIFGVPVIPSNAAGANLVGVAPAYILYADEGGTTIDVSREASVQMNSAPDNPAVATTILTSFWQQNLVGIKAERFVNWKRAITAAVQLVTNTAYPFSVAPEQQGVEHEVSPATTKNHGKHA